MNKIGEILSDRLPRFRDWQKEPLHYENKSTGVNVCANCGTEFSDNYCPRCGQKANVRRITWESVRQGVMQLWGMESRSFLYTLWQLLLRPGYLIKDYISGKRQVSYPPVKMLFFMAVAYVCLHRLLVMFNLEVAVSSNYDLLAIDMFKRLTGGNEAWGFILLSPLWIFPVWLMFRFAPGYDHHTLPEGFFIQVFMSTLILVVCCLADVIWVWLGVLIVLYYVVAYKQIFGYGWWGTVWRIALCCAVFLFSAVVLLGVTELVIKGESIEGLGITEDLLIISKFFLMGVVSALAGYFISRFFNKKAAKRDNPSENNDVIE